MSTKGNTLSFNLYDNVLVVLFLFFIPFSYALTFKIGFPLKISEITLFTIVLFYLYKQRFRVAISHLRLYKIIILFAVWIFISMLINLFWPYSYALGQYHTRFGYKFDSIMKFFYVIVAILAFIVSSNAFSRNREKYCRILIYGAIVAGIYTWYLFISSLLKIPVFKLPGMTDKLQTLSLNHLVMIRCGTFKEGNYMGLFLFVSAVIAFYQKKTKAGFFLLANILPTVSSMALICAFIFIILHFFKKYFTKKNLGKLLIFFSLVIITFALLSQNKSFHYLITSKFFGNTKKINNNAALSKADRLNSMKNAFLIGLNNPILGVGISNYGLHYKEFNTNKLFDRPGLKEIPNNVYLEIFSEEGVLGLILFVSFLYQLYKQVKQDNTNILKYGYLLTLFYLIAFPTFTVLFIWVFFGLIASLNTENASPMPERIKNTT